MAHRYRRCPMKEMKNKYSSELVVKEDQKNLIHEHLPWNNIQIFVCQWGLFYGEKIQRFHQKLKGVYDSKCIKNHQQKKFKKEGMTHNFKPSRGPVIEKAEHWEIWRSLEELKWPMSMVEERGLAIMGWKVNRRWDTKGRKSIPVSRSLAMRKRWETGKVARRKCLSLEGDF